jgi:hypothetical protein
MEDEMHAAMKQLEARKLEREEEIKASMKKTRIATPGVQPTPGTPKYTPRRFGL